MKIYNTAINLMPVDTGYLRESTSVDFRNGGLTGVVKIGSSYAIKRMSQLLVTVI
ncbi:hypothetical protein QVA48_01435 [Staphylococcus haemolyticus]|nr:hypothetical protein [Staphylococcus haemolyticus]